MEMPEGWKRYEEQIQKKIDDCYEQAKNTRDGACTPVGCLCYMTELEILDLMKKMAEAMEIYAKETAPGYLGPQNPLKDAARVWTPNEAAAVLKKFKEWE